MASVPPPYGTKSNSQRPDPQTTAPVKHTPPGTSGSPASPTVKPIDKDTKLLAATAYGEASTKDIFEEMAAIANVLVRQQKARSYPTIGEFIKKDTTFAFAAHDGNARYAKLVLAKDSEIVSDKGMSAALNAAINALSTTGIDYSNGAYFWDGADIKSNYDKHPKVRGGIHFTDPKHNIYGIEEKDVPGEEWWRDAQGKNTKLRGKWNYKYESTAAYGGTIFWKYNADFVKATGNKVYN